jgi:hypothetical protein
VALGIRSREAATLTSFDPWPSAMSKGPLACAQRRSAEALAAVATDRGVGDLETAQQPKRLREVARGDAYLVPVALQRLDHGAQDEHVGTVGEVDPDAHRQTVPPSGIGQMPAASADARGAVNETILIPPRASLGRSSPASGYR